MPAISVSPDSSSRHTRKVGSSLEKRLSALEKLATPSRALGLTASDITAAGTCIEVIVYITSPVVKVSPEAHSTPKSATISPATAVSISCISEACIRTMRGILTFLSLLTLTIKSPLFTRP